jgi:hypothetical protein
MTDHASTTAGFQATAGAARPSARLAFYAYSWPAGASRTHASMHRNVVITEPKLHLRWPEEPSS